MYVCVYREMLLGGKEGLVVMVCYVCMYPCCYLWMGFYVVCGLHSGPPSCFRRGGGECGYGWEWWGVVDGVGVGVSRRWRFGCVSSCVFLQRLAGVGKSG